MFPSNFLFLFIQPHLHTGGAAVFFLDRRPDDRR
jgi:hypothetical protein